MSAQSTEQRFENPSFSAEDYAKYKSFFQYLGAGTIVLILVLIGAVLFADIEPRINEIVTGISGYLTNVYTEILSVVITILILDRRAKNREEQRIAERNQRLIREVGSPDNATARNAIREIRDLKLLWGDKSILQNVRLGRANLVNAQLLVSNLSGAYLGFSNLSHAIIRSSNLSHTDIRHSNLSGADLGYSDLSHAILVHSNLSDTDLRQTNLSQACLGDTNLANANLKSANFSGASLRNANLVGADLENAIFTEKTILPEETYWTSDTDMTRYTDPQHPNFDQPMWARVGFDSWYDWLKAGYPRSSDK